MNKKRKVSYAQVNKVEVSTDTEAVQAAEIENGSSSFTRIVTSSTFGAIISLLIFDIFLHLIQYVPSNRDSETICDSTTSPSSSSNFSSSTDFPSHFEMQNIVMVKPGKVGGSTLSGVIRHIGAHYNLSGIREEHWIKEEPGIFAEHMTIDEEWWQRMQDLKMQTFLVTIIRDPIKRCLSDFHYFQKHGQNRDPNSFNDIKSYFWRYCTNYMLDYISLVEVDSDREITPRAESDSMKRRDINNVVSNYDLIGVTDRFNETMVLLKHMLGLKWRDVLYIPAKITGKAYKTFSEESQELQDYVENEWKSFKVNKDFYLYNAVMDELDRKIAAVPNFHEDLKKYEWLLDAVTRICRLGIRSMRCINDKQKKQCGIDDPSESYIKDAQRGYKCLDMIENVEQFF